MDSIYLESLSPLDGRYHQLTLPLTRFFSEKTLIQYRTIVEIEYLKTLSKNKIIRKFTKKELAILNKFLNLSNQQIIKIKEIEKITKHDVKAIEYFLAEQFKKTSLKDSIVWIHFGLTSEDINNLAYRLMITNAQKEILIPKLKAVLKKLNNISEEYLDLPILARTHGQPAIPTTLGKEISVFSMRLLKQLKKINSYQLKGKLSGAVGSFQALQFIKPEINWLNFSQDFIKSLNLIPNLHSTQINPADDIVELFHIYHLTNSILLDLNQDMWRYISDNWLILKNKTGEIGSSTMPLKVNPINFENSEGNLTLANGLIETIARKSPISRLQRDLSESTINRNLGVIFGYSLIAYENLLKGLNLIKPNKEKISLDLNQNFNILSEAVQTWFRNQNDDQAYQKTVLLMKNKQLTEKDWQKLTKTINHELSELNPEKYIGLAPKLTKLAIKDINKFLEGK